MRQIVSADKNQPRTAAALGLTGALIAGAGCAAALMGYQMAGVAACTAGIAVTATAWRLASLDWLQLMALTTIAVSSWDAVRVGPVHLVDGLLLFGMPIMLIIGVATGRLPELPTAVMIAVTVLFLTFIFNEFAPPSPGYMGGRAELAGWTANGPDVTATSNTGALARVLLALLAIPLLVTAFARDRFDLVKFGRAYCIGASINAALALSDSVGVTSVSVTLRGFADVSGRGAALTTHPNQLALAIALALPFAVACFNRLWSRLGLVVISLAGIWISGSRAGLLAAATALILMGLLSRRKMLTLAAVAMGVLGIIATDILAQTRLSSGLADESDYLRGIAAAQAKRDFLESPITGIGLSVGQQGHNIYLQLLAATGLLGLAAFVALMFWALRSSWVERADATVRAAGVSLLVFLVAGYASNSLLNRYLYVALGIVSAAVLLKRQQSLYAPSGREAGNFVAGVPKSELSPIAGRFEQLSPAPSTSRSARGVPR